MCSCSREPPPCEWRPRAGGRHKMELAVAHAALADSIVGQGPHRLDRTAQHRHLQAGIVVEMHVECRNLQIMMLVLRLGEPLAQAPCLMSVDVAERRNTEAIAAIAQRVERPGSVLPASPASSGSELKSSRKMSSDVSADSLSAHPGEGFLSDGDHVRKPPDLRPRHHHIRSQQGALTWQL